MQFGQVSITKGSSLRLERECFRSEHRDKTKPESKKTKKSRTRDTVSTITGKKLKEKKCKTYPHPIRNILLSTCDTSLTGSEIEIHPEGKNPFDTWHKETLSFAYN